MPTSAKRFQVVLDIVKDWWEDGMRSKMVNGQFAIEDVDRQSAAGAMLMRYIFMYTSKPECQMRGTMHLHYLHWDVSDE